MVAALRSESCEVTLATNRRQALGITRGHLDVLVLDFAIHSQEFSQPPSSPCRTLVLADSLEQLILALEKRVDAALVKPLDPTQVRVAIRNLLGGSRMQAWVEVWCPYSLPFSANADEPAEFDGRRWTQGRGSSAGGALSTMKYEAKSRNAGPFLNFGTLSRSRLAPDGTAARAAQKR